MCNKRMDTLWICLVQGGEGNHVDALESKHFYLFQLSTIGQVFLCLMLEQFSQNTLNEFVTLSGASTTSIWNSSITHVIAATDEHGACSRTLKVLMAILCGKWILRVDCKYLRPHHAIIFLDVMNKSFQILLIIHPSLSGLKACMEAGHPVTEEPYEITHDIHGSFDGPRNGRLRASQKVYTFLSLSLLFY